MSHSVIRADSLGKRYRVALRQDHAGRRPWSRAFRPFAYLASTVRRPKGDEIFWALRGVSFDVRQGEVVGIIGRNGAGKSTLLKILSRVTSPTEGIAQIRGRLGSLLEVGTGFHAELTGRENVYLNGSILGMARREIDSKLDEIVAFSEVERFLDTPVKRYSSGMYVRLAFAVAAHLEPDILLIDEVLSVGDASFQKKCLGKMEEVSQQGRTILLVSHNMATLSRVCQRGILLEAGRVVCDTTIGDAVRSYLQSDQGTTAERRWSNAAHAPGDAVARLKSVRVLGPDGRIAETVDVSEPVTIEMEFVNLKPGARLLSAFSFVNEQGVLLFVSFDFAERTWGQRPRVEGLYRSSCVVPAGLLAEGVVKVVAEVSTREPVYEIHFLERDSVAFHVVDGGGPGSIRSCWVRDIPGVVRPQLAWETEYLGNGEVTGMEQLPA